MKSTPICLALLGVNLSVTAALYTPLNLGSSANDGTGDSPRSGGQKINANFASIEAALNAQGLSLTNFSAGATNDLNSVLRALIVAYSNDATNHTSQAVGLVAEQCAVNLSAASNVLRLLIPATNSVSEPLLAVTNGLTGWFDANYQAGGNGSILSAFIDRSSNSLHLTAIGSPVVTNNAINGRRAIRLSGNDGFVVSNTSPLRLFSASQSTIYAVVKFTQATANATFLYAGDPALAASQTNNVSLKTPTATGGGLFRSAHGNFNTTFAYSSATNFWQATNTYALLTATHSNNQSQLYWNGFMVGSTNGLTNLVVAQPEGDFRIGTNVAGGVPMEIAEVLTYNVHHGSNTVAQVASYLREKWAGEYVAAGDSITEGLNASTNLNRYANLVAGGYGMPLKNFGISSTTLQFGITNNTTQVSTNSGQVRMHLFAWGRRVSLAFGVNDILATDPNNQFQASNFQTVLSNSVASLTNAGLAASNIILVSPPYFNPSRYTNGTSAGFSGGSVLKHEQFVGAVSNVAAAFRTKYAPVYETGKALGAIGVSADDLHPNDVGHSAISTAILNSR